jgi:hypothetical protein
MSVEKSKKMQERRLAIKRSLIGALVLWQKEGILTNFKSDEVLCNCFRPGSQESWLVSAKLLWNSADFNTQVRLRQAINDFAEQLAGETGLPATDFILQDDGVMKIQLYFYNN